MRKTFSKKLILMALILVVSLSVLGCWRKKPDNTLNQETEKIGQTYDVSDKSGQEITVAPNDILYLKLEGESKSGFHWQVASPTSGNFLVLRDHKLVGLDDPEVLSGKFTDEWWLKVQETGEANLQLDYVVPGKSKEPKNSFKLKIISQE